MCRESREDMFLFYLIQYNNFRKITNSKNQFENKKPIHSKNPPINNSKKIRKTKYFIWTCRHVLPFSFFLLRDNQWMNKAKMTMESNMYSHKGTGAFAATLRAIVA
eukprot:SAG25_NODE_177_length_12713_cov_474.755272_10_plen_106_part_00